MVSKRHANNHTERPGQRAIRQRGMESASVGIGDRLREAPWTFLAVGFGIGFAVGWVVADSVARPVADPSFGAFERVGRSVVDAVAAVVPESIAKRFSA